MSSTDPHAEPPEASHQAAPLSFGGGHVAYVPARSSSWVSRVGWFFLFIIPLAVVITATQVTPAPEGMGTHQQLGLPPCGFLVVTGIPCPGCGLTTSFAHMVRGQFSGATFANPFGVMLFLVTFFTIPVAAIGLYKGSPVLDTLERLHAEKWAILLSITSILVWVVRVARQLLS